MKSNYSKHHGKLFASFLIVVCLAVSLGFTACSASQHEMNDNLNIEENHPGDNTKHNEKPPASTSFLETHGESSIQLLSSVQQGDFMTVLFSISPVSEDIANSFFFEDMVTSFVFIASNNEITSEHWDIGKDGNDDIGLNFASPVPYVEGHESEHMIEISSQTGPPDETGEQTWINIKVIDPEWYNPLLMEYSYDQKSQSLALRADIYTRGRLDTTKPVYFSVRCLDERSLYQKDDETREEFLSNFAPVYLKDYGTVMIEAGVAERESLLQE